MHQRAERSQIGLLSSIGFVAAGIILVAIDSPWISTNPILVHMVFGTFGGVGLALATKKKRLLWLLPIICMLVFPLIWGLLATGLELVSPFFVGIPSEILPIFNIITVAPIGFAMGLLLAKMLIDTTVYLKYAFAGSLSFSVGFLAAILLIWMLDLDSYILVLITTYTIGGFGLGIFIVFRLILSSGNDPNAVKGVK